MRLKLKGDKEERLPKETADEKSLVMWSGEKEVLYIKNMEKPKKIEEDNKITYAVSCRHCEDPICIKSCISGALTKTNGVVTIDQNKCIGCFTCILVCPYGAVSASNDHAVQKCELCINNSCGTPACVKGCPNKAIVYEERN